MRVWGAVVAAVVAGGAVVTLTGFVLSATNSPPAQLSASVRGYVSTPAGRMPHAFISLATYPDSMAGEHGKNGGAHPDWVSYGPTTNLKVPAHSLVTMTIRQYDSGGPIYNSYFAQAHGTVGGTETINGKVVRGINPNTVAHTFTLHMFPANQPAMFVSVPLPQVPPTAPNLANGYPKPNVVTFSFVTGAPGRYVWNCEYPCGSYYRGFGGAMSTQGYMDGTLTVG
ncbi:MAG: hypothetical protein ACLQDY_13760 [Streptosporangiaceae bacterium]